ncbi:hypothetical protein MTO96_015407 [Rhipicephalus appendiculatus]
MTASSFEPNVMEDAFGNLSCAIVNGGDVENGSDVATAVPEDILGPRYHKRVRIVIIIVMIVASVAGNTIVCWKLVFKRRHRRVSKARVLFLNLAIADLLVACITMTSQVVWEVMGRVWIAGDAFCRFFKFLQTFALVSSTYMLVTIAVDRHIAIATPLGTQPGPLEAGSRDVARFVHAVVAERIYMGFVFFMVFVAPLLLLVTFYTGILWTIWKHSSRSGKMGQQTSSSLPRAKVKTLKMTAVVFGAFLVTNVPYMVQEVILAFGNPGILDANVVALFGVISASNSAINPYIFLYFEKRQRRGSRSALGRLLKRLPCLRSRLAGTNRGGQQMVMLTVHYSGRHSHTMTTVNCESCTCSEKTNC